ncbi:MAG: bifunctional nuclease family protein [Aeromicrobium sp.]|uniref:bifunctional nuclease family protein n=1 Tax=Aeromicrobium sp. TaxID=1871063 RepID=UPI00261882B6|nr:bifunctional nuclease family protein [Aeromicrobium sp.]MDF1703168.1 bifunctional nuclease family protein [Aeromicrobium sp.]
MREVEIVGVRVDMPANQPLVLLREVGGARVVPIWIGAVEASAIAFALQGTPTARPLTHELMGTLVEALGDELQRVEIVDVRDGIFYAELHFESGAVVEGRPSDGIALALRTGATVLVAEDVLDAAGLLPESDEEAEVERFREFLDDVDPEDFA